MNKIMFLLAAVALAPFAGCGSAGNPNQLPTAPVEVTVMYKGKPVDGAMVTFLPIGDKPAPSNGLTNAEGKAKMFTYESGDGAILGTHKVQIVKQDAAPAPAAASVSSPEYDPFAPPAAVVKSLIPKKYFNALTSGLTAEIEKGKVNQITFELKD